MLGYATMAAFNGFCAQLLHGDFKSHLKLQRAQPMRTTKPLIHNNNFLKLNPMLQPPSFSTVKSKDKVLLFLRSKSKNKVENGDARPLRHITPHICHTLQNY